MLLLERLLERVAETITGVAEDAVDEEQENGDDDCCLGGEILAHDVFTGGAGIRGADAPASRSLPLAGVAETESLQCIGL